MTKKKIKIPIYNQSIVVIITEEENSRYKAFVDYIYEQIKNIINNGIKQMVLQV